MTHYIFRIVFFFSILILELQVIANTPKVFPVVYSPEDSTKNQSFIDQLRISPIDQLFFTISGSVSEVKEYGLKAYKADMAIEKNLKSLFISLSRHDEDATKYGYINFKKDMEVPFQTRVSKKSLNHIFLPHESSKVRSFVCDSIDFLIPIDVVELFRQEFPNSKEVRFLLSEGRLYCVPVAEVDEFLANVKPAKFLFNYGNTSMPKFRNINDLHIYLRKKDGFTVPIEQFIIDMQDEKNQKRLYENLVKKDLLSLTYEKFKIIVSTNIVTNSAIPTNVKSSADVSTVHFQIDKIKVGDTYIDLPIPSGFVKIDNSMDNLLESAKKLCPSTNTLLAYYISEEDYANYLTTQINTNEKYILVEVFNGVKDLDVGYKDYRQFFNKYREEYIDDCKKQYDKVGPSISDNLSKIDERIKVSDLKMVPFGICYESKYSISTGVLTKYDFTVENENSDHYIVAAIMSITRIKEKPLFLYTYKNYKAKEDINEIRDINLNWLKEIEKQQGAFSFLTEIDFEDYKETIFAILTLSFLWGSYFATRKIRRKLKSRGFQEKPSEESTEDLVNFDDLLVNNYPSIEPTSDKFEKPICSDAEKSEILIDTTSNLIQKPIDKEFEEKESKFQNFNPKLFIVARRMRLFHFFIDMVLVYAVAYCSGFILPLFIDVRVLGPWLKEHNYLFGAIVIFLVYFFQEFIFGKTLGKLITGTHVVDAKGNRPTFWQFVGRTVSRMIPFEAFSFLWSDKRGWHDTISDTYVIKDK
jgi:uncharacterized RDD family membrane protein YckC